MFDADEDPPAASRLGRLVSDPVRLRRYTRIALVPATLIAGAAWGLPGDTWTTLLIAVTWIAAPLLAAGIGFGEAFFVSHGSGRRRALLTAIAGVTLVLLGCIGVSAIHESSPSGARAAADGAAYALFYAVVILTLATLIGLAVGRGAGYVARRIQQTDDEGW
jgi:hypothetical protein